MPKIQVQVTVESSSYDLGKQLGMLLIAIKNKKPLAEIAAMELVQIQALAKDVGDVKGDLAEDKVAFYKGAGLGLEESAEALFAPAAKA